MDRLDFEAARSVSRRRLLTAGISGGAALIAARALGADVDLRLPGGNSARPLTSDFPQKGEMILQRARPVLLETPMEVFQHNLYTPNDRFYVRWHWSDMPTSIDVDQYRIAIGGHVERPLSISLAQLLRMPRVELAAVNQCSGNSRGLFEPRVPGAQWGHGAMGNAKWMGVSLRHLLDLAGVRGGAVAVRIGDLVARGTVIGTAGSSLHLGLREGSRYVDPAQFFTSGSRRAVLVPVGRRPGSD